MTGGNESRLRLTPHLHDRDPRDRVAPAGIRVVIVSEDPVKDSKDKSKTNTFSRHT